MNKEDRRRHQAGLHLRPMRAAGGCADCIVNAAAHLVRGLSRTALVLLFTA
jgi:hypothetical protein